VRLIWLTEIELHISTDSQPTAEMSSRTSQCPSSWAAIDGKSSFPGLNGGLGEQSLVTQSGDHPQLVDLRWNHVRPWATVPSAKTRR
jgi:hypothetical protein